MVRRVVPRMSPAAPVRCGLLVLLASVSLPALAASGVSLKCGENPPPPAELQTQTSVSVESPADHELLTVLKADGEASSLGPASELGGIMRGQYDQDSARSTLELKALRSSALADALERRRQGRLKIPSDDMDASVQVPSIDTTLPGVGDSESLLYRREMFRTDI